MEDVNLEILDTEVINSNTENIDLGTSFDIIKIMNTEDKKVALAVERELYNISGAVDLVVKSLKNKGRLIYIGAGNSGRLAFGDACECVPTFGTYKGQVIGVLAGGTDALAYASEGAEDNKEAGILDLQKINLIENDIVIGLSASGRTPYVKAGLSYAKSIGCKVISVSCSKNSEIGQVTDISIEVLTGAEVINGSTRLKAGTAQKMILNMISTASMIKMGKVYKNYMIDVSIKNKKLEQRGVKIIAESTGVSKEKAVSLLKESNGSVKIAVLMGLTNKTFIECKSLVAKNPYIRELI